jgi:hypothetical protein
VVGLNDFFLVVLEWVIYLINGFGVANRRARPPNGGALLDSLDIRDEYLTRETAAFWA